MTATHVKKFSIPVLGLLFCLPLATHAEVAANEVATTEVIAAESPNSHWGRSVTGTVTDRQGKALDHASLIVDGVETETDAQGKFSINGISPDAVILIKKPGYRRVQIGARSVAHFNIELDAQAINAIYVATELAIKNEPQFQEDMSLLKTTQLNAIVLNVKDDDGHIDGDLRSTVDRLHSEGVYVIARIVTFKDVVAVRQHPELALIDSRTNLPWKDSKGITYLNPYNSKARDYVLQVAKTAAEQGFDEIQFDYVRFPTDRSRSLVRWDTASFDSDSRTAAISGFLAEAKKTLSPHGVFIAADVFGITAYDHTDSGIGQEVEQITKHLDYVCPMVYPSGFAMNAGGPGAPDDHPGAIVQDSVRRYRMRADADAVVRPWLQAFRDYAFDHREYGEEEIRAQIDASNSADGVGFLLWNAGSRYTNAGLAAKGSAPRNRMARNP